MIEHLKKRREEREKRGIVIKGKRDIIMYKRDRKVREGIGKVQLQK